VVDDEGGDGIWIEVICSAVCIKDCGKLEVTVAV
jgi:hypothetical protein